MVQSLRPGEFYEGLAARVGVWFLFGHWRTCVLASYKRASSRFTESFSFISGKLLKTDVSNVDLHALGSLKEELGAEYLFPWL